MNAHVKTPATAEGLPQVASDEAVTIRPTGMPEIKLWALDDDCVAIEQGEEIVAIPKRLAAGFVAGFNDIASPETPFDFQAGLTSWRNRCSVVSALAGVAERQCDLLGKHFDDLLDDAIFDEVNAADAVLAARARNFRDVQVKLEVWQNLVDDADCILDKHIDFFRILRDDVARLTKAAAS